MMKVVLINPPQFTADVQPPMGLSLIAAVLEKEGYQVSILDANALRLQLKDIVSYTASADVVGLTAMTPTINIAIVIARQIKLAHPSLPIILGGAHGTLLPGETLTNAKQIDVIVRGEGEETIIKLLQALEYKQPLDNIPGISYTKDGNIISTAIKSTNVDLDSLPFLAYHLLPLNRYKPLPPHGRALPFAAIITSRGCPYKCCYCSKPIFGDKFRGQTPQRVIEEVWDYKEKFGIKELAFYDDVFTLKKERAYSIADEMIKGNLKICWTCETRVNLVDRELLLHMKNAGCYAIAYGIESGSQEMLETLNKGINLKQIEDVVRISKEVGLQTIGYFMIGSPGETPETIASTIQFAKKLSLDFAQFSVTTPFPGTKLYDTYKKNTSKITPWENFIYTGSVKNITPVFESATLKRADLQHGVRRAYKEFYLRPSYLWQRIRRTASWGDLKTNVRGFILLLKDIR